MWNDPRLVKINEGITLPKMKIVVVHRSDGSGTTFIFTDYLSKISDEWSKKVSRGKSVNWPTGLGAKGNEGVTGLVKQIPGSIGYVELAYTIKNNMPRAHVQNQKGNFIEPSLESTSLAAQAEIPDDTRVSLTNSNGEKGYPISGFTWILVYQEQNYNSRSLEKAKILVDLLWWMTHEGQNYTKPLDYAPLPDGAVDKAEIILKSITYNGEPLKK
jgi:phosphate transport system substrate-binding protein